ncbi:hypothetical protein [Enterobacter asburiae]|uniref:hypothetical protein n=1 Tax=Enterobacter asburiae TaxID=61645 RepID=UPI003BE5E64E
MLKRIIRKMVSQKSVQRFPSDNFDSSQEGFIIIASPEDIAELIATPGFVPEQTLKRIINTAIKELEKRKS